MEGSGCMDNTSECFHQVGIKFVVASIIQSMLQFLQTCLLNGSIYDFMIQFSLEAQHCI